MDGLGFLILFALIGIVMLAVRRVRGTGRLRIPLDRFFGPPAPGNDVGLADHMIDAVFAMGRRVGGVFAVPRHVHVRAPADDVDFITSNIGDIHRYVVDKINSTGPARARKMGSSFKPIDSLDLSSGIAIGPLGAVASYGAKPNPFLGPEDEVPTDKLSIRVLAGRAPVVRPVTSRWGGNLEVVTEPMEPPTTPPTSPPATDVDRCVLTSMFNGARFSRKMVTIGDDPVTVQVGRASGSEILLPNIGGISSTHLVLRFVRDELWATDVSSYGTWVKVDGTWTKLGHKETTRVDRTAEFALDKRRTVIVSASLENED